MVRKRSITSPWRDIDDAPSTTDEERSSPTSSRSKEKQMLDGDLNHSLIFSPLISSKNRNKKIWGFCLAFRAINSLLIRTYFDPDEHWQSLEVAHRIVFGYGHLTWEWKRGIRSYAHPLIFALLYTILDLLHLDTPWFMTRAPRLWQSVFSSVGDLYLYKFSCIIFDEHVACWAVSFVLIEHVGFKRTLFISPFSSSKHLILFITQKYPLTFNHKLFCQLTNWFMFFCITRTYSNCLESVLSTIALYHWFSPKSSPRKSPTVSKKLALFVAAVACILRPTSAIMWIYLGLLELVLTTNRARFLFLEVLPIGVVVFTLSCLLDRWMYGSWIIVPLNFMKFNFLSTGADYYGNHKWHWYFTQGFPTISFTYLPLSLYGIYEAKEWKVSCLIAWVLVIYSFLGHKEFRFILPILPLALMFSGYSLAKMVHLPLMHKSPKVYPKKYSWRMLIVSLLLITNIPLALYTSLIHQRGREDVMTFLAKEAHGGQVKSILFLMPCHSTPYYSTFHHKLPMRFLDCTPGGKKGILDESDRFRIDPFNFMSQIAANWTIPSHIVLFDRHGAQLRELLHSHSFKEEARFFNAHFPAGSNRMHGTMLRSKLPFFIYLRGKKRIPL